MLKAVKNIHKILIALFLIISIWASPSSFSKGLAEIPAFSPDIHLDQNKAVVADEESAYPYGTGLGKVDFGLLPQSADVDAVHGLSNGGVLFSLETSILLDGTLYRPSDVIRFDGGA